MSSTKKKRDNGSDDNWLVSYADMMTLVCCFFILMMAFANYDPVGFNEKTKELAKHFNKDKYKSSMTRMNQLKEEVSKHPNLEKVTKISVKDNALVVSFSGTTLFKEKQTKLTKNTTASLDALIDLIKTKNQDYRILIEGHTSNVPINDPTGKLSHWSISSSRASAVAERFDFFGFDIKNIVAIGHGASKPAYPNQDKFGDDIRENILLNNRVVIKVLESLDSSKKMKLGLGVYLDK